MFRRTGSPAARHIIEPTSEPLVSFIFVTFGTDSAMIDGALGRLISSCAADDVLAEIIVVDNFHPKRGHTTGQHLALTTSGVRLAMPDENLGFGGGNELGVAAARGSVLCLVNPDLMVNDGWLAPMLEELAAHPDDLIAPRLLAADGSVDEAGQWVGPNGLTAPASGAHIDYASAACWMLRTETHERIGGFDPRFHPAYFEDVDFAFRLRRLGGCVRIHPTVAVTHLRGGSVGRVHGQTDISKQLHTFVGLWGNELWRQPPIGVRRAIAAAS
jgi:GT2 family glycosyltransferase